ncbi:branched-chain amino acid ABC transporter permease [Devosia sp.]|uniref:branched-chain amino acid ABC transporter permease n=1 Tax=Devosia sp. TaxID=1871048 RepID=UPI002F0DC612
MSPRMLLTAGGLLLLVAVPFSQGPYGLYVLSLWLVFSMSAMGLNLTLGYAGQVSMAQAAFMGIGAYTSALLTMAGVHWLIAAPAAAALCFLVGLLLGYPALRVQHHFLAFVTLAFTTLVWLVLRNEEWLTGGNYGLAGVPRPTFGGVSTMPPMNFYYFTLAVFVLVAAGLYGIVRSPWGRAFRALRENPVRADSLGVDIRKITLLSFAIGGAIGGISGALLAPLVQFIDPSGFTLLISLKILLMVVVGGSGYFLGPLLGAGLVIVVPEYLRFAEGYYLMIFGALVVVLMIFCPSGLIGLGQRIAGSLKPKRVARADLKQGALL